MQELISLMTSGITQLATGIGSGLNEMVTSAFLTGAGTTESPYALSAFGGVIAIFAGIALAVGLTTLVTRWVMSLGGRN